MEDRRIFKFWVALGMIVAIFFFCFGVRTFAYDDIPIEFNWIYRKNGDSNIYTWNNGFASNVEGLDFFGLETGFPIPEYAGDGEYSLFFHFKFTCDMSPVPQFKLVVAPGSSRESLYPTTGMANYITNSLYGETPWGELVTYNANCKSYYGTFSWQGHSNFSTYEMLVLREKSPDYTNQYTYSVYGVLDARIMMEDQMSPFRLGVEIGGAPSYSTFTAYNVDMSLRALDSIDQHTLVEILRGLGDIGTALNSVTQVPWTWYTNTVTSYLSTIMSRLSGISGVDFDNQLFVIRALIDAQNDELASIYDDNETDEDITQWASDAVVFESKVDDLHEIEESMIGTLSSFEFPTAGTYTEVERSFFDFWFLDPLLTPMILTGLALMIAFLIL